MLPREKAFAGEQYFCLLFIVFLLFYAICGNSAYQTATESLKN